MSDFIIYSNFVCRVHNKYVTGVSNKQVIQCPKDIETCIGTIAWKHRKEYGHLFVG